MPLDPRNVKVEFYVFENGTVADPGAVSQVYSSLSAAAMSAELGLEVNRLGYVLLVQLDGSYTCNSEYNSSLKLVCVARPETG